MPFMIGQHPIRRTLQHLNNNQLVLKPFVQILSINYRKNQPNHLGATEFVYWHSAQLQYKNPNVQIITFKNLTPTPFIRVFFTSGKELLMDIDRQSKQEIYDRVVKSLCKTKEELEQERRESETVENPAYFGYGCKRHCMCELPGQVPCPAIVPLPYHMRGKYRFGFAELDESKYVDPPPELQ